MGNGLLLEEIRRLPVIDTHKHFERYGETFGYIMPQFFYHASGASVYAKHLPAADTAILESEKVSQTGRRPARR